MTLQVQTFLQEIDAIASSGEKGTMCALECTIHANGKDLTPYYVNSLMRERNYVDDYAEVIVVDLTLAPGMLQYEILPFKDNLEITLRRLPLGENVVFTKDDETPIVAKRYRAVPFKTNSKVLEANNTGMVNQEMADKVDVTTAKFQLLDPLIEQLRTQTVGGIFRSMSGVNLIRYLLGKYSREVDVDDDFAVKGVTVLPGANPEVREHIIVPHLTPFNKFPELINKICGGIYPSGFRYYLQNGFWYLYTPFDIKGYEKSPKTISLMNVPAGRLPNPERSFRETATQVLALTTGEVQHTDKSEEMLLNLGSGTRFIDASRVMDGFVSVSGNVMTIEKSKNINEFVAENRPTGINLIAESPQRITANYLTEYAELARRQGSLINAVWENADPDLIYPGMAVKFMYVQNNVVEELYGTVNGTKTLEQPSNQNPKNRRFTANTLVSIFVTRKVRLG